jgi:hypothetical protein
MLYSITTTLLPPGKNDHIRRQTAHNIKKLYRQQKERPNYTSMQTKKENKIIHKIKEKLTDNIVPR